MSVIFSIFAKKEGNSRAIGRIFSKNRGNSSHFLVSLPFYQNGQLNYLACYIRHIFRAKVSPIK